MTSAPTSTGVSTWTIDPTHTTVEFAVTHLSISTFKGRFRTVEGTLRIDEGNPANSSVTASIDATSLDVLGDRFQGHLKGEDFFQAEAHPRITFQSTGATKVDDSRWRIAGDLTIRGVTRPVVLDTEYLGQANHPFSGKTFAAFRATTEVDRGDFGIVWNAPLDSGAKYVGEQVRITLDIEAVRQDEA